MSLYQLIYCSRSTDLSEQDITRILEASKRNNPKDFITGMLMFDSSRFLQLLEGPRSKITQRFTAISQDTRHTDVELIHVGPADFRLFSDWAMHYAASRGALSDLTTPFYTSGSFDPASMTISAITQMCKDRAAYNIAQAA
jgi:hypothetical protein